MKMKKQGIFTLASILAVNGFVAYQFFGKKKVGNHWDKVQTVDKRGPASKKIPGDYKEYPMVYPFEDFFLYDNHSGKIDYQFDVQFWSDKGAKYFTRNGKEAVEKGLTAGFERLVKKSAEDDLTLSAAVLPEITKEFLNTFVYTIKVHKLIDSNFEVDFRFKPIQKDTLTYKDELKTNQLIDTNTTGTLFDRYKSSGMSFIEKVNAVDIPLTNDEYQYLGGAITISAELLDTNWKVTNPIPNPKQNAIKGKLRLRKYFRVNYPKDFKLEGFNNDKIKITKQDFSVEKGQSAVITIDQNYSFNLEELFPKKDSTTIHFGTLKSLDKTQDNLIKKIFSVFKKSNDIKTSQFSFKGDFEQGPIKSHFTANVKSLVYDHKKKEFTKHSKILTHVRDSGMRTSFKSSLKKSLLKNNADYVVKKLNLERFIK